MRWVIIMTSMIFLALGFNDLTIKLTTNYWLVCYMIENIALLNFLENKQQKKSRRAMTERVWKI